MPRNLRIAFGAIAAVLYILIIVLFVRGPRFTTSGYGDPVVKVECGSIMTVGWPSDASFVSDETSGWWGDHAESDLDSLPDGAREGVARDCSERRDTYLGFMIVLSIPATLLGAAALVARPARAREDTVAGG